MTSETVRVIPNGGWDALMRDLEVEFERAFHQWEKYKQTGVSTAGHGGSHDSCFGHIIKQHTSTISVTERQETFLLKELIKRGESSKDGNIYYASGVASQLDSFQKFNLARIVEMGPLQPTSVPHGVAQSLIKLGLVVKICSNGIPNCLGATSFAHQVASHC